MRKRIPVKGLAIAACIGMFLVLLMGVTVTQTESGRGCGDTWPLCHDKFIPAYTLESMVEYSHRMVSAIVGLVILASTIAVFMAIRRKDARIYASGGLFFTIVQAGLGAAQVKNPQSDAILALHFGFSLLALTFTLLTVIAVRDVLREAKEGPRPQHATRISSGFRTAVWLVTAYTYVVVYTGAYTSHTDSGGGCTGFPFCNGQLIPSALEGATAVAFTHRTAGYVLFIAVLLLSLYALKNVKHPEIRTGATWSIVLVALQVASGGLLMALMGSDYYVFGTLLHTMAISVLFAVLSYLSIAVWFAGRRKHA